MDIFKFIEAFVLWNELMRFLVLFLCCYQVFWSYERIRLKNCCEMSHLILIQDERILLVKYCPHVLIFLKQVCVLAGPYFMMKYPCCQMQVDDSLNFEPSETES